MFTVGFVAMSRHIVNSGAFYSYISHGLGRVVGVGAAFVALPAYALMQIGLFGLFGVVASGLLQAARHTRSAGSRARWSAWALVAVLGLLWVDLSGRVLAVLLIAEITIVLIYDLVMVANPAGGSVSFATLSPAQRAHPRVRRAAGGRDRRLRRLRGDRRAVGGGQGPAPDHRPGHPLGGPAAGPALRRCRRGRCR